ncbi:MAG TPA: RNA polymerase sigma factor [Bacteroides sp.]|nr:RNA polymerase sigma factor [Bacteroides sp.]
MTVEEYNRCVEDHSDGLYRFILKNIRDSEKAEDIVQDSYEKLWRKVKDIQYSKSKSYLFSTAYHTMIDVIRKDKRMENFSQKKAESIAHERQYSDLQEILNNALEKLPEIQRTVILLRDYEGYSYTEIGEITSLSESQVKVYIYRGRIFLKQYIGSLQAVI